MSRIQWLLDELLEETRYGGDTQALRRAAHKDGTEDLRRALLLTVHGHMFQAALGVGDGTMTLEQIEEMIKNVDVE